MPSSNQDAAGFVGAVTRALVAIDVSDVQTSELQAAGLYVERSISEMPDTLRFGVRMAGLASSGLLSLLGRGRFRTLPADRQRAAVAKFADLSLPVVGEYVRLTRGLGLVSVYESRSGVLREFSPEGDA